MDLGAYAQIEDLSKIMADNGIVVPRLRGIRLMSEEKMVPPDAIAKIAHDYGIYECESLCESDFRLNSNSFELSSRTRRTKKKYLIYEKDQCTPIGVRWDRIHGKKRKAFKFVIKNAALRVYTQYTLFNRYCGEPDILYVHARIGGGNWPHYRKEVENQSWFICKVDDSYDSTYCDIYARIKPLEE